MAVLGYGRDDKFKVDIKAVIFCTMPASLLVEQRKMMFNNKTLHIKNIVLRILCFTLKLGPKTVIRVFWTRAVLTLRHRAVWSRFIT